MLDAVKKQALALSPTGRNSTFIPIAKQVPKMVTFDLETKNLDDRIGKTLFAKKQALKDNPFFSGKGTHYLKTATVNAADFKDLYISNIDFRVLEDRVRRQLDTDSIMHMYGSKAWSGSDIMTSPIEDLKESISRHRHYIDAEELPWANPEYDPDFLKAFTWGPLGEWVGLPYNEEIAHKLSFLMRQRAPIQGYKTTGEYGFVAHPLEGRADRGFGPGVVLLYENYRCMEDSRNESAGRGRDNLSVSRFFAGVIQRKLIDLNHLDEWLKALRSGKFTPGFGVMRDGDDRYDPFGVLAEINGAEWTWSDREGAYVLDKKTQSNQIDTETFMSYLGIRSEVPEFLAAEMLKSLLKISDDATSFAEVIEDITRGIRMMNERQRRLFDIINALPARPYYEREMIRPSVLVGADDDLAIGPSNKTYSNLKVDPLEWREFNRRYGI